MNDLLRYLAEGVPTGCVYALVAIGLVLAFKTSGVFNLAFGAQAFLSLAVYYSLRVEHGWTIVPAFVVAVLIVAPLTGLLLDRLLFRFLRGKSWQVRLVTALGLLAGLPQVIQVVFGSNPYVNPPGIAPNPDWVWNLGNDVHMSANEVYAIGATVIVVGLLFLLFQFTALGLQMRAVVESPRMVELAGVDSERVGMAAWMLSSLMAGVAGVLLGPLYGSIDANSFTTLLVVSITAAAFGRLVSLPLTLLGAIGLGVLQSALAGSLDPASQLAQGLRPTLPFLVLSLLLIFWVGNRREATDPLRGVDPPPPNLAVTYQDKRLRRTNQIVFPVFLLALFGSVFFWLPDLWVFRITNGLVIAVMLLSITVITGLGGQVSAAQATFAGLGGYAAAQFASQWGTSVPVTMLVGAAFAGVLGALVAIVSIRLSGIYLTLLTLAAALAADNFLYHFDWFGIFPDGLDGGSAGLTVERPRLLGFNLNSGFTSHGVSGDQAFFVFTFVVFAFAALIVILLRKGTTGRYLAALRGSETAAPSIGINPTGARIIVFSISAAIAGLGGGLYAMLNGGLYPGGDPNFSALYGLVFVVLVVTLGARTVDGAVNAGLGFVLSQVLLDELGFGINSAAITVIGFAFGAITYARHPEGIVELQKLRSILATLAHRALAARVEVLERAGHLRSRVRPQRAVVAVALPAVAYVTVLIVTGESVTANQVLVYGILLTGAAVVAGVLCHVWLRRTHDLGLSGALGLLYATPATFFLVPNDIARKAREDYRQSTVEWVTGVAPVVIIAANAYIQIRRSGSEPATTLAWAIVLAVGTILVVTWVSRVVWAIAELQVLDAERSAGPEVAKAAEAALPVGAAPGAG
jgi:branched-subunit amino acid ABC-type transport system permease component